MKTLELSPRHFSFSLPLNKFDLTNIFCDFDIKSYKVIKKNSFYFKHYVCLYMCITRGKKEYYECQYREMKYQCTNNDLGLFALALVKSFKDFNKKTRNYIRNKINDLSYYTGDVLTEGL